MTRPRLLGLLLVAASACSRSSSRPRAQAPRPAPAQRAQAPAAPRMDDHEAEEQREIAEAVRGMSAFPDTADGARGFVTELARASIARDAERWERLERELVADRPRFELALTFEGARQLRDRVLPSLEARAGELRGRLAALREPLTVTVKSAMESELSGAQPHGFSAGMVALRPHLRETVRFYRAEVAGADGGRVAVEPLAFLGGRWTWLGEPWAALPPPAVPSAPSSPTAVR